MYKIRYWCTSHVGLVRQNNQDNFCCDGYFDSWDHPMNPIGLQGCASTDKCRLFGVFDGLGGEQHGEIASFLAAQAASGFTASQNPADALLQLCRHTNQRICEETRHHALRSMGTTCAMLAFYHGSVTLCNIGDSRVYLFSDHVLTQISRDHICPAIPGRKPLLSQNLGIPPRVLTIEPYLSAGRCVDADLYLLCSDGLTDLVPETEISEILDTQPPEKAAAELRDRALRCGGRDNITILLCQVNSVIPPIRRLKSSLFPSEQKPDKAGLRCAAEAVVHNLAGETAEAAYLLGFRHSGYEKSFCQTRMDAEPDAVLVGGVFRSCGSSASRAAADLSRHLPRTGSGDPASAIRDAIQAAQLHMDFRADALNAAVVAVRGHTFKLFHLGSCAAFVLRDHQAILLTRDPAEEPVFPGEEPESDPEQEALPAHSDSMFFLPKPKETPWLEWVPGDRVLICTGEPLPKDLVALVNADGACTDALNMLDDCPDDSYAALLLRLEDPTKKNIKF